MSSPATTKEVGTLAYFKRSMNIRGVLSILSLLAFVICISITVPVFFTHFWLIIPLSLTLLFAKSFGAWEAYTKMREQTEVMQLELDELNKDVERLENNAAAEETTRV